MKRVAYILDDGRRNFTYARVSGFCEAIRKTGEPIELYIFRSAGLAEYEPAHNKGEYNIYRLPVFSDFDGIFLDINNNYNNDQNRYGARGTSYVIRAAAASHKPVICLANLIADFYYIGIDNRAAMISMVEYLHKQLGLSSFWFVMGPADNFENQVRTGALREYCSFNSLPCEDDRFYAESFALETGVHGFMRLYERFEGKLPQAVICANDEIALGVCQTAAKKGIRIPEDLMVTGFDNLDISAYLTPTVTTVDQLSFTMGEACIDLILRIWNKEDVPRQTYTPTKLILRESTGSEHPSGYEFADRVAEALYSDLYNESFNNRLCTVQYRLPGCGSVEEMCRALENLIPSIQCRGFYLVLDRALYDYGSKIRLDQSTGQARNQNTGLKTEGYPESMELVFSWEEEKGAAYPGKMIKGIFPAFASKEGGRDYLFVPLHFMEETVGYLVICGCTQILHTQNIASVANSLTMALRSFFAGKKLEYLNQMLSGISMKDDLTGLFNRLGYHRLAFDLFRKTQDKGGRLGVIFIDMDDMKYFNDTFGHACGDDAVCCVADAIRSNISGDAIPVRFGGDEFLIITAAAEQEDVTSIIDGIKRSVHEEAQKKNLPAVPGISTGFVITDPEDRMTLNEYTEEADRLMYIDKKLRKAGRE